MTTAELIEVLSALPADTPVLTYNDEYHEACDATVEVEERIRVERQLGTSSVEVTWHEPKESVYDGARSPVVRPAREYGDPVQVVTLF